MHIGRNPLPDLLLIMVRRARDEELASGAGYVSGEDRVGEGSPGVYQGSWSWEAIRLDGVVSIAKKHLDDVVGPAGGAGGGIDLEVVDRME